MRFEVRRLHDEYRYTTVYVTHDQSEAMTTADLIAVMNAGKIEQAGSPEEIYDRPRSEFVARFIGSSNIVKGKALDADHIEVAGVPLALHRRGDDGGRRAAISIRQHEISAVGDAARRRRRTRCRRPWSAMSSSATAATIWSSSPTARSCAWSRPPEQSVPQGDKVWLAAAAAALPRAGG